MGNRNKRNADISHNATNASNTKDTARSLTILRESCIFFSTSVRQVTSQISHVQPDSRNCCPFQRIHPYFCPFLRVPLVLIPVFKEKNWLGSLCCGYPDAGREIDNSRKTWDYAPIRRRQEAEPSHVWGFRSQHHPSFGRLAPSIQMAGTRWSDRREARSEKHWFFRRNSG